MNGKQPKYVKKLNQKIFKIFEGKAHAALKDGCLFLTGELSCWDDIVRAGLMSVNKKKYTVVNDIVLKGAQLQPARLPSVRDNSLDGASPDVLVIGGGVTGCAIARELARYKLSVMLTEKEHDVALHASSRNDGMVHPGVDLRKGQLKKKYNDAGNDMYPSVCKELDVPFKYTGQYLCFTDRWLKPVGILSLLYWKIMKIPAKYISRKELKKIEPHLNKKIKFALLFPKSGVVCPYGLTIAYAENAACNGAKICLDTAVTGMTVSDKNIVSAIKTADTSTIDDIKTSSISIVSANKKADTSPIDGIKTPSISIISVETNRGTVYPKLVVNAAGVFAEDIARLANDRFFSIHPRRGTNLILDKKSAYNVKTIASVLQLKSRSSSKKEHSKGGGIIHTVDDNLLVGPNAIETFEKENFSTYRQNVKAVLDKQKITAPELSERDIITYFTGVRAATYEEDFIVSFGKKTRNIIHAAGIQSPGLTAAPAIARDIAKMAAEYLGAPLNEKFNPVRKAVVRAKELSCEERDALIKTNPDYGVIVCRCEEVSRGEVLDALRRSVPCDTVDGVKRRVRPGMGRCQGSFCSPQIVKIIAEEKNIPLEEVRKMSENSRILLGENKTVNSE